MSGKFRIFGMFRYFIFSWGNTPFEIRILCVRGGAGLFLDIP